MSRNCHNYSFDHDTCLFYIFTMTKINQNAQDLAGRPHPLDRYNGERRDCTVIALAAVTGLPYPRCHAALKDAGRKDRRGIPFVRVAQRVAGHVGHSFAICTRGGTLRRFVQENPQGAFYVTIRGHAFAVLDGVIHDNCKPRLRSIIKRAWRVEPPDRQAHHEAVSK